MIMLDYYRGKNFTKHFCLDLKKHATKIINYKEKEMILLTKEQEKIQCKMLHMEKQDLVLMMTKKIL